MSLAVGVCVEVIGRPEKKPFIYLYEAGIALDVGGSSEALKLIQDLHQAIMHLTDSA